MCVVFNDKVGYLVKTRCKDEQLSSHHILHYNIVTAEANMSTGHHGILGVSHGNDCQKYDGRCDDLMSPGRAAIDKADGQDRGERRRSKTPV
jgi:hypothetical protein